MYAFLTMKKNKRKDMDIFRPINSDVVLEPIMTLGWRLGYNLHTCVLCLCVCWRLFLVVFCWMCVRTSNGVFYSATSLVIPHTDAVNTPLGSTAFRRTVTLMWSGVYAPMDPRAMLYVAQAPG